MKKIQASNKMWRSKIDELNDSIVSALKRFHSDSSNSDQGQFVVHLKEKKVEILRSSGVSVIFGNQRVVDCQNIESYFQFSLSFDEILKSLWTLLQEILTILLEIVLKMCSYKEICALFLHTQEPLNIGFFGKAKSSTTGRFSTHELRGYYLEEEQLVKTNSLSLNEGLSTIKGSCNFF